MTNNKSNCYTTKNVIVRMMIILMVLIITIINYASSFTITSPSSNNDYQELASLLVESFDEPTIINTDSENGNENGNGNTSPQKQQLEQITWGLYDKFLTEQYTFRQYVQTARKMKGKKYSLYLAKEYNPGIKRGREENEPPRPFYEVIGMIELGMVLAPTISSIIEKDEHHDSTIDDMNSNGVGLRPRATVGVLCVNSKHMKKGIGKALLKKCEEEVKMVWNETRLFIEVEPDNIGALKFFESCGYDICVDDNGANIIHNAQVCRKRRMEERPHFVMSKSIIGD